MDELTTEEFRNFARRAIASFGTHTMDEAAWQLFADRLTYVPVVPAAVSRDRWAAGGPQVLELKP